ncbi:hypothetical protein MCOR25_002942 [Pyricularia grisea]|uniref:Uncharacterized protein n=1 Tax=Pyricularia grisea TaxID=148305 RepID=A0A6P8AU75_PYRGI|nr:uncharacterized protein PgNI_08746 [Pyricularia grisea]KAI6375372.1 hypothetical protein MCOR25_002942 [Pyricularia grisea]TLD05750.1 hypothetical protein PgNI_08746 [Pyricularia grisea]
MSSSNLPDLKMASKKLLTRLMRSSKADFRITYYIYMDPSLAVENSRLLARAFNDPATKGNFREVRVEEDGISSQEPIDLVALQIDAAAIPVASGHAGILAENRAVRKFCTDTYQLLHNPAFVNRALGLPTTAPLPWTHLHIRRTDVGPQDPCYTDKYYLPQAWWPWVAGAPSAHPTAAPGMACFRILAQAATCCVASDPSLSPVLFEQPWCLGAYGVVLMRMVARFSRCADELRREIDGVLGPGGVEVRHGQAVADLIYSLSREMQNVVAVLRRKHWDHFGQPSRSCRLRSRYNIWIGGRRHDARRVFERQLLEVQQSMTAATTTLRTLAMTTRLSSPDGKSPAGLASVLAATRAKVMTPAERQAVLGFVARAWCGADEHYSNHPQPHPSQTMMRDSLVRGAQRWAGEHDEARRHLRGLLGMWWDVEAWLDPAAVNDDNRAAVEGALAPPAWAGQGERCGLGRPAWVLGCAEAARSVVRVPFPGGAGGGEKAGKDAESNRDSSSRSSSTLCGSSDQEPQSANWRVVSGEHDGVPPSWVRRAREMRGMQWVMI